MAITIASIKVLSFHEKEVAGFYPALQMFQIRAIDLLNVFTEFILRTKESPTHNLVKLPGETNVMLLKERKKGEIVTCFLC